MIKGIIFDFDGLLLDTEYPQFQSWQEAYKLYGCELPLPEWAICIGTGAIFDPVAYLQARTGVSVDRESILNQHRVRCKELIEMEPVLPGVKETLAAARQLGVKMGVASSSPQAWVYGHLERLGLLPYMDIIRTADDVKQVKPDPELFTSAAAGLDIRPSEILVFEDSPNGILAAQRAGMYCIVIPNRLTSQLDIHGADLILPAMNAIPLEKLIYTIPSKASQATRGRLEDTLWNVSS